jgi:hypothetical protein
MKKLISIALIVLSLGLQLFAGVPSWTVNPSDYSNSMVMVGTINLDGVESVDENDMIAAFIDGEVRGVANIKFEAVANRYLAYMLIYSNESSGDITFKMYDADQDVALDLQNTTNFTINGLIGNVASPHIWSDVFLNTGSEITTFGILEIVDEVDIDSQTINIAIGIADDITDLVATFRVSEGARVTVDNTAQTSGITTNDFTDPVVYTVTSENGDNSTIYTVMVSIINNPPADLALSALAINENNEVNAVIGAFTVDDDEVNHDFSMVNGEGSEDNGLFDILNDELISMQILDFEDRSSYSIRVAVTDSASQTLEKSFSINVNDINESPTDIALEMGTVGEHSLAGIVVGVLSSSDPDAGDIFSYSIGSSTDDSFFSVSGNNLELAQSLDYETQASYSVELIVTDIGENTYAKTFTIDISDENDAPTSISLDSESVYENVSFGTVIGNLTAADQDADDVQIFSLAAGTGDTDNSLVIVAGNRLLLNSTIDFETNNTMAIRLKVEDATTDSFEQEFLIEILDANDSPIDFLLSNILVPENQADGFVVGELTVVDTDPTTMTYTFITGQNDNGYFALDGTQLITVGSFDFELQDELLIDVLATDIDNQSIVN